MLNDWAKNKSILSAATSLAAIDKFLHKRFTAAAKNFKNELPSVWAQMLKDPELTEEQKALITNAQKKNSYLKLSQNFQQQINHFANNNQWKKAFSLLLIAEIINICWCALLKTGKVATYIPDTQQKENFVCLITNFAEITIYLKEFINKKITTNILTSSAINFSNIDWNNISIASSDAKELQSALQAQLKNVVSANNNLQNIKKEADNILKKL